MYGISKDDIEQMVTMAVDALETMADGDLGDRMTQATAKMAKKYQAAFKEQGFSPDQCYELTKIALRASLTKQG